MLPSLAFALLLAASPVTEQVVTEDNGTSRLAHDVLVPAPPAAVWTALATVEGWKSWAVPIAWAPTADMIETSYNPAAKAGDPANIKNQVLARIPPRLMIMRTVQAPPGFPHAEALASVVQIFELAPEGDGTRVRLTGTGYTASAGGQAMLAFFRTGNRVSLEMLRDRFEKGPTDWTAKLGQRQK